LSCALESFYDGSAHSNIQSALYLITLIKNDIMCVSQVSSDTRFVRRVMTTHEVLAGIADRIESV
jgi:hypothetical protein